MHLVSKYNRQVVSRLPFTKSQPLRSTVNANHKQSIFKFIRNCNNIQIHDCQRKILTSYPEAHADAQELLFMLRWTLFVLVKSVTLVNAPSNSSYLLLGVWTKNEQAKQQTNQGKHALGRKRILTVTALEKLFSDQQHILRKTDENSSIYEAIKSSTYIMPPTRVASKTTSGKSFTMQQRLKKQSRSVFCAIAGCVRVCYFSNACNGSEYREGAPTANVLGKIALVHCRIQYLPAKRRVSAL